MSDKFLLHELSWKDIKDLNQDTTVFILPIGSTEQHGPQNPLGTDFLIAQSIAIDAAMKTENVFCLPTLPIGVASHHRDFPGTLWTSPQTLLQLVKDVLHSMLHHGFKKLIVCNGHGGNTSAIMQAISECNDKDEMKCLLFEWWNDEDLIKSVFGVPGAVHADAVETSVIWAAEESLVQTDKFNQLTSSEEWGRKIGDLYFTSRTIQFTESGIAGPIEGISREKGLKVLEKAVFKLSNAAIELSIYI